LTHDERARGGLYDVEEEDNGEAQQMDEREEEEVLEFPVLVVDNFPAPTQTAIVYENNGHEFSFDVRHIPTTFHSVLPGAMLGLRRYPKVTAKNKANVCFQPTLPFIVHASPIVALFQCVFVGEKANFVPQDLLRKNTFRTYMSSVVELQFLKLAIISSFIPFHASFTPNTVSQLSKQYDQQVKALEARTNAELDAFYASASSRDEFIGICRKHAFSYIHLLEAFIYAAVVAPHQGAPDFAQIMTPIIEGDCTDPAWLEDVEQFFRHKAEEQTPPDCPVRIEWNTIQTQQEGPVYRKFLPLRILDQYIELMRDTQ
jgi:hypothetical protein